MRKRFHEPIQDGSQVNSETINMAVTVSNFSIDIEAEGYNATGSCDSNQLGNGTGAIVTIERWEGELRCIVWADINREDPTHIISLEEAKITNRKEP
jgi:hypothetical protein